MSRHFPSASVLAGFVLLITTMAFCSNPADPVPGVESIALSADSVAIQFRDSSSELTATPKGALGVDLDAGVRWQSKNTSIVAIVPNGKSVRLVPVRPGTTDVEATSEHIVATAKVVVLDTVFSVTLSAPDTLVSMGRALQFTATVAGPPGVSQAVVWSVGNTAVAYVDSSRGKNPVQVVSHDTGSTTVIATSAIDRKKSATARLRTARPVSLHFESQPGQTSVPIRANDILIPGPIVFARDILGNVFPGPVPVTLAIVPETGTSGARLFGTPVLTTAGGAAKFENVGIDSSGTDYRLTATSLGLTSATSAPFSVGPECPGTPYTLGTTITGTLTTSACLSSNNVYYARYIITSTTQQFFTIKGTQPMRGALVFPGGERYGGGADSVAPAVVPPGSYSIRVMSAQPGQTGGFALTTGTPNLPIGITGQIVCQLVQTVPGIDFTDLLRCSNAAGAGGMFYRLHLKANNGATVSVSTAAFEPSIRVTLDGVNGPLVVEDPAVAGRFSAQVVVPPAPVAGNVVVSIGSRTGAPVLTAFRIIIHPR